MWSSTMTWIHLVAVLSLSFLSGSLPKAKGSLEVGEGLRQDAEALQAFKREIEQDPYGGLRDWGADMNANPCLWHGVECAPVPTPDQNVEDRVVSLELWGMELVGSISSQIGKLSQLQKLTIVGNKFSGTIPVEIQNCKRLSTLDLRANGLSGYIGFSLADLPLLQVLKLSENQLTGTINRLFDDQNNFESFDPFHLLGVRSSKPAPLKSCPHLAVLDLAQNRLSGKLPTALGECTQLLEVSLNDNVFIGSIPASFSFLPQLRSLFLNNNRLEGPLPSSIAAGCKMLQFFSVADNLLTGEIPLEYAKCGGRPQFNFANNRLQGRIPVGRWNVQQMALEGVFSSNPGLCGWPLTEACEKPSKRSDGDLSFQSNPASLIDRTRGWFVQLYNKMQRLGRDLVGAHETGKSHWAKLLENKRRLLAEDGSPSPAPSLAEGSPSPAPSPSSGVDGSPAPAPSGDGHKSKHTARRWALGLILGLVAGAIAATLLATFVRLCVFYMHKTPLLQGPIIFHPTITPKMLSFLDKDESLSEAEVIGEGGAGRVYMAKLKDEKGDDDIVVAVKSVVVKEDEKGLFGQKQIQAELETLGCIRHRNLVDLLAYVHKPDCHLLVYLYMENGSLHQTLQKAQAGELDLPWPIRHKIAVGAANGLSYLHFNCNPRILHRDLKTSNILLDSSFVAHVSDFGLAKVIPGADTHVSTGLAGTVGYIAPEYSQTWRFTDKSDVYSFGVVLAVLLTGKEPTDPFFQNVSGGRIGSWLHDVLQKGEGKDAIDPKLLGSGYEEEILLAMKIAVFCTQHDPTERPSSQDVLVMLKQIRTGE